MTQLRAPMGNVTLSLPGDSDLLAAAGSVALVHGQLELMLRMTFKTLSGLSVEEALDATRAMKNWELRKEIERLFKHKTKDPIIQAKLKAILGKCEALSQDRNKMLHNAWAIAPDGSIITKGTKHAWGKAPDIQELNDLAAEIDQCVQHLNKARLKGFIHDVCKKPINP